MEAVWASAAFQPDHTVLKLRLRPFSCGHEILLSSLESPVAIGGSADWNDLFTAVVICAQTFKDGLDLVRNPRKFRFFGRIWRLTLGRKLNLAHELSRFRGYLECGQWSPPTMNVLTGSEMRALKAPRAFRLIWFLCSEMRMTEEQALDYPLARANAYYAAAADKRGEIDLQGKDEDDLIKRVQAMDEAEARGEKVWPSD